MRLLVSASVVLALLAGMALADETAKAPVAAAGTPAISLTGVKSVSEIWIDGLKKLPPVTIAVSQMTGHGPIHASFTGALLWAVIDQAGWVNGPEKNAKIRHTIFVTGKDGYAAALSEGEIDPEFEGKKVLLAYEENGVPLNAPRLVVPGDFHAARSVQDVVSVDVH